MAVVITLFALQLTLGSFLGLLGLLLEENRKQLVCCCTYILPHNSSQAFPCAHQAPTKSRVSARSTFVYMVTSRAALQVAEF